MTRMTSTLLELHVPSFEPVRKFYAQLGFETCWEHPPEGRKGYLVLALEENVLCFWSGNEEIHSHKYFRTFGKNAPNGVGVEIVLQVSNLASYYEQVKSDIEIFEPIQLRPWGLKDFRIVDPFGYYLRLTERFDIRDINYGGRV